MRIPATILVPVADNAGEEFSRLHHEVFEAHLLASFGGYQTAPGRVRGGWKDDAGTVFPDELYAYTVAVDGMIGSGQRLAEMVAFAKGHYSQLAIYVSYLNVSEILWSTLVESTDDTLRSLRMTYTTLSGRELDLSDVTPAEAAFFERAKAAAEDPAVSRADLVALVYGLDNPILDTTYMPGGAWVTPAVFARPIYHAFSDLRDVKAVRLGLLDIEKAHAAYTVDVPTAARQLGITPQAVRAAIDSYRLGGIFRNGQWWLRPESIASFKVSRAGRPRAKAKARKQPAA